MHYNQIGSYCKYSRVLRSVSTYNFIAGDYISHWASLYKNNNVDYDIIVNKCKEKLKSGLTDTKDMVELVRLSKDSEKEKSKIIDYLLGVENKKSSSTKESCSYYYKQLKKETKVS